MMKNIAEKIKLCQFRLKGVFFKSSGNHIVVPIFLFLEIMTTDLRHRPGFDQIF
jgi:hypothetical protein